MQSHSRKHSLYFRSKTGGVPPLPYPGLSRESSSRPSTGSWSPLVSDITPVSAPSPPGPARNLACLPPSLSCIYLNNIRVECRGLLGFPGSINPFGRGRGCRKKATMTPSATRRKPGMLESGVCPECHQRRRTTRTKPDGPWFIARFTKRLKKSPLSLLGPQHLRS